MLQDIRLGGPVFLFISICPPFLKGCFSICFVTTLPDCLCDDGSRFEPLLVSYLVVNDAWPIWFRLSKPKKSRFWLTPMIHLVQYSLTCSGQWQGTKAVALPYGWYTTLAADIEWRTVSRHRSSMLPLSYIKCGCRHLSLWCKLERQSFL